MNAALIGLGSMGRRHLQVLRSMDLDVVGLCDLDLAARSGVAEEFAIGDGVLFEDAKELLGTVAPDVVVVATTAPSHGAIVQMASEKGARFILCEKPIATSVQEARSMIETCTQNGTHLAINHQMRFMPHYISLRRIIESERFGGWTSLAIIAGNFGLAMNGVHYFELFRWLTDGARVEVAAWLDPDSVPNPRGEQFEDRGGSVRMNTKEGQRLYMEAGTAQGHGLQVVVAGAQGVLVIDELTGDARVTVRRVENASLPTTRYATAGETWTEALPPADTLEPTRLVLEALLNDRDYPTGEHGEEALRRLMAAHISNERGGISVAPDDVPPTMVLPIA